MGRAHCSIISALLGIRHLPSTHIIILDVTISAPIIDYTKRICVSMYMMYVCSIYMTFDIYIY